MQIDGAIVKEQGITFAIVIVQRSVLNNSAEIDNAREAFSQVFPGMPLILMAQDGRGTPTYQGRQDIVRFLANVHPSRIPWKRFTVN